jgi:excinuclease ABC subunit C
MKGPKELYGHLPDAPGCYIMYDARGRILYIGKAANLRRRVSSYFLRPHDARIQKMVSEIRDIQYRETDSALEALILEAELIKREIPPYNIREKDDKSFLFVEITKDPYPRVLLMRGKAEQAGERFGPFVSASSIREAMRILRKIFPWNTHPPEAIGKMGRPCFDFQLGLCPGTCFQEVDKAEYKETVKNLKMFLKGKKRLLIRRLEKEMKEASDALQFEKAGKLKKRIFALRHIQDTSLIGKEEKDEKKGNGTRIEGYDISNISGTDAVGVMVVLENGSPKKSDYRKFIVKTVRGSNDTGMLKEVMERRLKNDWSLPHVMLIDGGKGQVNAVEAVLEAAGLSIPVVGIAKGPERKKNEFVGKIPAGIAEAELIRARDEAHRFAINFHRYRRSRPLKDLRRRLS